MAVRPINTPSAVSAASNSAVSSGSPDCKRLPAAKAALLARSSCRSLGTIEDISDRCFGETEALTDIGAHREGTRGRSKSRYGGSFDVAVRTEEQQSELQPLMR